MCVCIYIKVHPRFTYSAYRERGGETKFSYRSREREKVPLADRLARGRRKLLVFIFYLRKSAKSFLEDETLVLLSCIFNFVQIIISSLCFIGERGWKKNEKLFASSHADDCLHQSFVFSPLVQSV